MQICWIWQKVSSTSDRGFQRFLDNVQYKSSGILRYERVFGEGFVSTGGIGMYHTASLDQSLYLHSDCIFGLNQHDPPIFLVSSI